MSAAPPRLISLLVGYTEIGSAMRSGGEVLVMTINSPQEHMLKPVQPTSSRNTVDNTTCVAPALHLKLQQNQAQCGKMKLCNLILSICKNDVSVCKHPDPATNRHLELPMHCMQLCSCAYRDIYSTWHLTQQPSYVTADDAHIKCPRPNTIGDRALHHISTPKKARGLDISAKTRCTSSDVHCSSG